MEIEDIIKKVKNHNPTIIGMDRLVKFAVLLPFMRINDEVHLLFEVRAKKLKRQPGEICFPGGKVEPTDHDAKHTAIRETSEELGISADMIQHVYPLDYVMTAYGTVVYPFVGMIDPDASLEPNKDEVGEVFTVPFQFFLETKPEIYEVHFRAEPEENFPYESIIGGKKYKWNSPKIEEHFYYYKDKVIWGLTARMIYYFIDMLKSEPSLK
ncbi:MAG: CoA pyrophosphatase [Bacillaceae bacterium]|uniref:Coenzyme A pyrophosphatase n=2 Tax=Bacillaceae TaxID=186817 RepID=A0A165WBC0_9BACI|nr:MULTISPECIES: CoA pyrophosphatase [Aeribacillus]KZN94840.1 coenzyme A pyrophosphatase [Aeribacillus pallidus]MED0703960.1 CoA pyrophosphatase [Aeribacillus composti]REJ13233.1 MAG: CoA pyrophosphatase [Bacillaceae bacterium]